MSSYILITADSTEPLNCQPSKEQLEIMADIFVQNYLAEIKNDAETCIKCLAPESIINENDPPADLRGLYSGELEPFSVRIKELISSSLASQLYMYGVKFRKADIKPTENGGVLFAFLGNKDPKIILSAIEKMDAKEYFYDFLNMRDVMERQEAFADHKAALADDIEKIYIRLSKCEKESDGIYAQLGLIIKRFDGAAVLYKSFAWINNIGSGIYPDQMQLYRKGSLSGCSDDEIIRKLADAVDE